MAEDKNVNIKIKTEADLKAIKDVEKELDNATKKLVDMDVAAETFDGQADRVDTLKEKLVGLKDEFAKTTKKADGGFKKMFPTFSKLGGSLKGLAGSMASFFNPVTAGLAVVTAAVGFAINKYKKWQEGVKLAAEAASLSIIQHHSDLKSLVATERESVIAVENSAKAQKLAAKQTDERTAAIKRLENEQLAITDAALALKLSEIDLARASGKISEEEASSARLKARRNADDAKVGIKRKADLEEIAALEQKLLNQRAELAKIEKGGAEATNKLDNLLNAKDDREKARIAGSGASNVKVVLKRKEVAVANDKFAENKTPENLRAIKVAKKELEEEVNKRIKVLEDEMKVRESVVKDFEKGAKSIKAAEANISRLLNNKKADFNSNETVGAQVRSTRQKAEDNLLESKKIREEKVSTRKANAVSSSSLLPFEKESPASRLSSASDAFSDSRAGTVDRANFNKIKEAAIAANEPGNESRELADLVTLMKSMAVSQRTFNAKKQAAFEELQKVVAEMKSQLENGPGTRD